MPVSTRTPPFVPQVPGYEILEELGRGGAGVVYKAWQTGLHRLVALKVLASGAGAGPGELARFQSEAEAVARLRHPHIVPIHEVGQADGRPYFVLDYLPGGSLASRLAKEPAQPRQAAEMMQTLARAIHFAHQNGILHRDLKPGNILLDADGTPKVADFGLAQRLDLETAVLQERLTPTGMILGTPSYMAPEQAGGSTRHLGPAADIYALGGILYEMLTGRPPFEGPTLTETLLLVLDAEPIPPRRLNPQVPRDLETICLRCLQKRPASRYTSAADLADDLERFLDGRPIQARPVGRLERLLKWSRRRPAQAALLAVCILALVLGVAGIVWHQIELQQKNDALAKALAAEEKQQRRNLELLRLTLEVESSYGDYLDEQLKPLPHLTEIRSRLLDKRLAFYKPILDQEPNDPEMRRTQGQAHLAVGVIQQKLSRFEEAEKSYRAALERLELPEEQASPDSLRALASAKVQYGILLNTRDRDDEADHFLAEGEHLLDQLVTEAPDAENRRALALACHNRAAFLSKKGQREAARQGYERAIELRQRLMEEDPTDERYPRELAGSYVNLAALYSRVQQRDSARTELHRAEALLKSLPPDVENRYLLAGVYLNLGVLEPERTPAHAIAYFQQALELWSKLLAQFPEVTDYRRRTAAAYFLLGLRYAAAGQFTEAEEALRQHGTLSRELVQQAPNSLADQREVSQGLYYLGQVVQVRGRPAEAESLWREQQTLVEALLRRQPEDASLHQALALVLGQLGDLDRVRGIRWRFGPPWGLTPVPAHVGVALHNLSLLAIGPAYLARAADAYRRGMKEDRRLVKMDPARSVRHFTGLSRHAFALVLVAEQRNSYEDLADAAEGAAEAARGLASQSDGGRLYRLAAGYAASCAALVGRAEHLSEQERTARRRRHADEAISLLRSAEDSGFRNAADLERAPAFASIRSRPEFQKLLTAMKQKK
jgi:serine/threonine-protein kinase